MRNPWLNLALDSWSLGLEASTVIGLRLSKLARGDAAALAEAQRMVSEKIEAAAELRWKAMTGSLGTTPQSAVRGSVSHLRKAVGKNRRRLTRGK